MQVEKRMKNFSLHRCSLGCDRYRQDEDKPVIDFPCFDDQKRPFQAGAKAFKLEIHLAGPILMQADFHMLTARKCTPCCSAWSQVSSENASRQLRPHLRAGSSISQLIVRQLFASHGRAGHLALKR